MKCILLLKHLILFIAVCLIQVFAFANTEADFPKVIFSQKAGFYENPFSLTLSTPDQQYDIRYTIDGSNPQLSSTAKNAGKEATINVNPSSSTGRATTPCFIVRACLKKPGQNAELPVSRTYIFLKEVIAQKNPGGDWPSTNINGQIIDLEMDTKVTLSATYQSQMVDALKAIPSISVVSDMDGLFGSQKGIYVNADRHGEEWERFCSVELIDPKQKDEFNVNAGLRIRGGWSRHDNYPKHAFRLFFNANYGYPKLEFPLFGDEGADQFDKVDLRTAQNYSWGNGQNHNTFVREVFSRDSQRDMGQPYTRSRYYHLYLNGMYWGLYQTQERSEARYAATYFGGSVDDYDVVKVNTENFNYKIEATDGNLDIWETVWEYCKAGFSDNRVYYALEGKSTKGVVDPKSEKLVDIDNLIDYMITIFYTGNFDSPTTAFGGNQGPNNFYAIKKRDDRTNGFVFFAHDAEHSMMIDPISPGTGLYENRVEIPNMNVSSFQSFHPQWLHQKLTVNAEYRQRFADRVYRHLFNDGVYTPAQAQARFLKRAAEIQMAIVAESARWGDTFNSQAKTRDDDWQPEIDKMVRDFFPERSDIVIDQLVAADLFNYISPPKFEVDGNLLNSSKIYFDQSAQVKISTSNTGSEIYITLDGSDPREQGGKVSSSAQLIENGKQFDLLASAWYKARIKKGQEWSPLREVMVLKRWENYFNLKVTELHYHPLDSIIGSDTISEEKFEFIEIKNINTAPVYLSALKFDSGIDYHFKDNEMLAPEKFYVIAASSKWFFERYGKVASGSYNKSFSNAGELVSLVSDNNRQVLSFEYLDDKPWPASTDGEGHSLSSISRYVFGDPSDHNYWKASTFVHGSPFYDDSGWKLEVTSDENSSDFLSVYPNPASRYINVHYDNDEPGKLELMNASGRSIYRTEIVGNTIIYLNQLNVQPGILLVRISTNQESVIRKILYQP